ncbi:hypothetical protein KM427_09725 [Nocardioides sp. LMS-CY]|uniref:hypothetical protein n=1 Tax=Nocardioides sp. (strain LMS-CY) TaxID=2840457 RepID=UPI001C0084F2|nr:hypothetical protein [Nocardioides sp. LMS-CY]QWF23936.1 hypothetical protein KM427_09725 [Nocardioides sp. LMS-CY]
MTTLPTYEAEQLAGLLALLPDVDAVELKVTISDQDRPGVIEALGIDPLDAGLRQVAFVDTRELALSAAGLVLRVRRTQDKPGDVTVKLRPMLPADVPEGLRGIPGFKVEVDASPAGYTCSCSLTAEVSDKKARRVLTGNRTIADVLSDEQGALVLARLPEGVTMEDLRVLGPVTLLKAKFEHRDYPHRMVAELWFLPDGVRILELSTKCPPADAFRVAAETKVFLAGHGVDLSTPQEAKTRTTLAALAARMEQEDGA